MATTPGTPAAWKALSSGASRVPGGARISVLLSSDGSSYAPTIRYQASEPRARNSEPTKNPDSFRKAVVAMTSPGSRGSCPRCSSIMPLTSGLTVSISRRSVSSRPYRVRILVCAVLSFRDWAPGGIAEGRRFGSLSDRGLYLS